MSSQEGKGSEEAPVFDKRLNGLRKWWAKKKARGKGNRWVRHKGGKTRFNLNAGRGHVRSKTFPLAEERKLDISKDVLSEEEDDPDVSEDTEETGDSQDEEEVEVKAEADKMENLSQGGEKKKLLQLMSEQFNSATISDQTVIATPKRGNRVPRLTRKRKSDVLEGDKTAETPPPVVTPQTPSPAPTSSNALTNVLKKVRKEMPETPSPSNTSLTMTRKKRSELEKKSGKGAGVDEKDSSEDTASISEASEVESRAEEINNDKSNPKTRKKGKGKDKTLSESHVDNDSGTESPSVVNKSKSKLQALSDEDQLAENTKSLPGIGRGRGKGRGSVESSTSTPSPVGRGKGRSRLPSKDESNDSKVKGKVKAETERADASTSSPAGVGRGRLKKPGGGEDNSSPNTLAANSETVGGIQGKPNLRAPVGSQTANAGNASPSMSVAGRVRGKKSISDDASSQGCSPTRVMPKKSKVKSGENDSLSTPEVMSKKGKGKAGEFGNTSMPELQPEVIPKKGRGKAGENDSPSSMPELPPEVMLKKAKGKAAENSNTSTLEAVPKRSKGKVGENDRPSTPEVPPSTGQQRRSSTPLQNEPSPAPETKRKRFSLSRDFNHDLSPISKRGKQVTIPEMVKKHETGSVVKSYPSRVKKEEQEVTMTPKPEETVMSEEISEDTKSEETLEDVKSEVMPEAINSEVMPEAIKSEEMSEVDNTSESDKKADENCPSEVEVKAETLTDKTDSLGKTAKKKKKYFKGLKYSFGKKKRKVTTGAGRGRKSYAVSRLEVSQETDSVVSEDIDLESIDSSSQDVPSEQHSQDAGDNALDDLNSDAVDNDDCEIENSTKTPDGEDVMLDDESMDDLTLEESVDDIAEEAISETVLGETTGQTEMQEMTPEEVALKETVTEVESKEIVMEVESEETVTEDELKETVAEVEVKETVAEVEVKETVAEIELKKVAAEELPAGSLDTQEQITTGTSVVSTDTNTISECISEDARAVVAEVVVGEGSIEKMTKGETVPAVETGEIMPESEPIAEKATNMQWEHEATAEIDPAVEEEEEEEEIDPGTEMVVGVDVSEVPTMDTSEVTAVDSSEAPVVDSSDVNQGIEYTAEAIPYGGEVVTLPEHHEVAEEHAREEGTLGSGVMDDSVCETGNTGEVRQSDVHAEHAAVEPNIESSVDPVDIDVVGVPEEENNAGLVPSEVEQPVSIDNEKEKAVESEHMDVDVEVSIPAKEVVQDNSQMEQEAIEDPTREVVQDNSQMEQEAIEDPKKQENPGVPIAEEEKVCRQPAEEALTVKEPLPLNDHNLRTATRRRQSVNKRRLEDLGMEGGQNSDSSDSLGETRALPIEGVRKSKRLSRNSSPHPLAVAAPRSPEGAGSGSSRPEASQSSNVAAPSLTNVLCKCRVTENPLAVGITGDVYCRAVDSFDGRMIGCCNLVSEHTYYRVSGKIPFMLLCKIHKQRLRLHNCCPWCGLFCTQGVFNECSWDQNGARHYFHKHCSLLLAKASLCPHCGSDQPPKEVQLELKMNRKPVIYLKQQQERKESSARMTWSKAEESVSEPEQIPEGEPSLEVNGTVITAHKLPLGLDREKLRDAIRSINTGKTFNAKPSAKAVYWSCKQNDLEKLLHVLVNGVSPNIRVKEYGNQTGLHVAASYNVLAAVHVLILAGATMDMADMQLMSPLMVAITKGHNDVVQYLIQAGASLMAKNQEGMTSLHLAAQCGNFLACQYIVDSGRLTRHSINTQDEGGWTALVWASENRYINVVKFLLDRGGNPQLCDVEQNTALHWAAFSGSTQICSMLLDRGCSLRSMNAHGDTPLHIAARQNHTDAVVLFLARGARIDIVNSKHQTPMDCAIPDTDVHLQLSLNSKLLAVMKQNNFRTEKILSSDIAAGKEEVPIPCVNGLDDEQLPKDYLYIAENCEASNVSIDRTITSLKWCECEDGCNADMCACGQLNFQCWYDPDGRLLSNFNYTDPPMIFECNRACGCNKLSCNNRVVQHGISAHLQLFKTDGKGWGVRALKTIQKGTYVCEYVGEIITDLEADQREDDSYLFDLDNRDSETFCIDARGYGNIARFINHLCEPNLTPVKVFIDHQDLTFPRIAFFANRDIKADEELGFDYGEKFWIIKYKHFTCTCSSERCKYSSETIHTTLDNYNKKAMQPSRS